MIISNVYYLLKQSSTHEKVIEKLTQLITITEVLATDKDVILKALNSNFSDFEDALQNYSAELNGHIDIIITRNIKDFKNSSLGVMTPGNYLKTTIASRQQLIKLFYETKFHNISSGSHCSYWHCGTCNHDSFTLDRGTSRKPRSVQSLL